METWPQGLALAIAHRVVRRKRRCFDHYPDLSDEDLIQEGLIAARRAWTRFDPRKGLASTWLYRTIAFRILDIRRSRAALALRDGLAAALADRSRAQEPDESPRPLADVVAEIHRRARLLERWGGPRPPRVPGRPAALTLAQEVALLYLARRLSLSRRGLHLLLVAQPQLRAAAGLTAVPSAASLGRLQKKWRKIRVELTGIE